MLEVKIEDWRIHRCQEPTNILIVRYVITKHTLEGHCGPLTVGRSPNSDRYAFCSPGPYSRVPTLLY